MCITVEVWGQTQFILWRVNVVLPGTLDGDYYLIVNTDNTNLVEGGFLRNKQQSGVKYPLFR